MKEAAADLRSVIDLTLPLLRALEESQVSEKPRPDKWSKKEILGHLVDSACNNQVKFVRTMGASHLDSYGYRQDQWVADQNHQGRPWEELVSVWEAYNRHLAFVVEQVGPDVEENTISIEGAGPFTLEFIVKDYVEHLKHHLIQILPGVGLSSSFVNLY